MTMRHRLPAFAVWFALLWATPLGAQQVVTTAPQPGVTIRPSILFPSAPIRLPDGSAAAPSLTFASDPDTGLFSVAGNYLGFTTAGGNSVAIGNSGLFLGVSTLLGWSSTASAIGATDLIVSRDGANVLALKNGVNVQEFRVYGTTTGPIYTSVKNTGAYGMLTTNSTNALYFGVNNSGFWYLDGSGGHLKAATDNTVDIGASGANRPKDIWAAGSIFASGSLYGAGAQLTAAVITAGSGTGVTVNNAGSVQQHLYKVTIDRTAFVCAATTCDVTIATLPAKTFVVHALADLTTTFACTATCTTGTLSFVLGKTAGGAEYLVSFDADAAAVVRGDAAAELGASLTEATIPTAIGDLASWTATTAVVLRLTSGTGNIGNGAATNLSQGSVTLYLTTVRY
jgi:hypothetical protein